MSIYRAKVRQIARLDKGDLGFLIFYNNLRYLLEEKTGAARERRYLPLFPMITMTYRGTQVICVARWAIKCRVNL